jgi:hypothetical protein
MGNAGFIVCFSASIEDVVPFDRQVELVPQQILHLNCHILFMWFLEKDQSACLKRTKMMAYSSSLSGEFECYRIGQSSRD